MDRWTGRVLTATPRLRHPARYIESIHRSDVAIEAPSTMIDLAILGLLTEQELHGYELKKRLGELLSSRASVSFGSLYPALARLEKQGCVKAVEERTSVPARPDVGLAGRRAGRLPGPRPRVGPRQGHRPGQEGLRHHRARARAPPRAAVRPRRERRPRLHAARRLRPRPPGRRPASSCSSAAAPSCSAAATTCAAARAAPPAAARTPTSARSSSATPRTSPTTSPGSTGSSTASARSLDRCRRPGRTCQEEPTT